MITWSVIQSNLSNSSSSKWKEVKDVDVKDHFYFRKGSLCKSKTVYMCVRAYL